MELNVRYTIKWNPKNSQIQKMKKQNAIKRNLVGKVAESCDWSTQRDICVTCIQNDLRSFLEPLANKLEKIRLECCHEVTEKLRKIFENNDLAWDIYGAAQADILQSKSISRQKLEAVFKPLITMLNGTEGNKITKKVARKLAKLCLSPPPTKEEAARARLVMLRFGMIPYEKMTPSEKTEYNRQRHIQWQEERDRRIQAERTLGIHSGW